MGRLAFNAEAPAPIQDLPSVSYHEHGLHLDFIWSSWCSIVSLLHGIDES